MVLIVFGQALCRGDVTPKVCQKCVANASQEIMEECQSEDAIIWFELCHIQYSYQMFLSLTVYTGKYPDSNNMEKNVSKQDHFQVCYVLAFSFSKFQRPFGIDNKQVTDAQPVLSIFVT
ncbi:hypothetical protein RJ639_032601 [Escallonia herrerae]|uniref:Gnk2-homologous domain-containing protein n=1 Tax=Escallonia herrerae TaxID=1293975 RepID=A0AA89B9I5_9ASTE|nr:hypothetical protein RJ639_032601 [Escallonia herrerae]